MLLTPEDITQRVAHLPEWRLEGQTLRRDYRFADFMAAIAFVNRVVEPAEAAGHHPDITISYNRVTLILTTHDAGGLTAKDFDLATVLNSLT
ncbi:MAG: 4a-hydroxytetrahydrobiopterin dehydratase [Gloeomargaritaceae cyanobacterium C42_A2020_066]|nr:4a-hydroxytetrahydrobiopterin dehydratase [Gloeomargaritaceae cyanobacterium C42_A2020_066]